MFDPKPALVKYQGQRPGSVDLRTERQTGGLMPTPFEFQKYGQSGIEVSEICCRTWRSVIDDVCVIRSMYSFNPTHTPALQSVPHRHDPVEPAVAGILDFLRARDREREPAGVCGAGFGGRRRGGTGRVA